MTEEKLRWGSARDAQGNEYAPHEGTLEEYIAMNYPRYAGAKSWEEVKKWGQHDDKRIS